MLWVPKKGDLLVQHNAGSVATLLPGDQVTTGNSTNVKGTPVQVFASTNFDAYWVTVIASDYGSAGRSAACCLDILMGASTEEVLIPNLLAGYCGRIGTVAPGPKRWDFPLYIPAATRIAIQAAGTATSTAFRCQIWLRGGAGYPDFPVGSKVTTYGIGTVPSGTTVTPGNSAAEGAWTQITASTTEDHFAIMPSYQLFNDATVTAQALSVDVGYGAATEELIGESYIYGTSSNEEMSGPDASFPIFKEIPSGSRLVMRASTNIVTPDAAYQGALHCLS